MNEPIISVSGLRGVLGESLSPEIVSRYARAFASSLAPGALVLARDGRASGEMLTCAIRAGLMAEGRNCIDAGVAATPTLGVLVREHNAAGGIQVSASHNPSQYNGLKAMGPDGRVIPSAAGEQVIERYRAARDGWVSHEQIGTARSLSETIAAHWEKIREIVDVERIRQANFRVLLDANHGAGSVLGTVLLRELGCDPVVLGETPNGQFEHPPEPTPENLVGVLAKVCESGAQIGFCQDPDADRLAVVDEEGNYLGEEYTLALCVDHVLRSRKGPIVTNCSTSRMSEDLAEKYGVPFYRSAVGEANVVDTMLAHDALLGGEGNGGAIDPRVGLIRDSFVGMALILDAMAARDKRVSQLAAELPRYEICKRKISMVPENGVPENVAEGLDRLKAAFSDAATDSLDGVRFDWPGKWLLVRASNTEPVVRAIAEAKTLAEAESLCEKAASILGEVTSRR